LVSFEASADDTCFACSYLSQRTGAYRTLNSAEVWSSTGTIRPSTLSGYRAQRGGPNRARAPPLVGLLA
jgi:hypothetical protein